MHSRNFKFLTTLLLEKVEGTVLFVFNKISKVLNFIGEKRMHKRHSFIFQCRFKLMIIPGTLLFNFTLDVSYRITI